MNQIKWRKHDTKHKIVYQAYVSSDYSNPGFGLTDRQMQPIQDWCDAHDCGKRLSFDLFQFRNQAEVTAFMLRWL